MDKRYNKFKPKKGATYSYGTVNNQNKPQDNVPNRYKSTRECLKETHKKTKNFTEDLNTRDVVQAMHLYIAPFKDRIAELEAEIKAKDKEIMTEYQKYSGQVNFLKGKRAELEAKNKELVEALEKIKQEALYPSDFSVSCYKMIVMVEQALKPKGDES